MKRLKIVAQIILLILSVINVTLAAPMIVRGIRDVRVDVVDVAEDVTTTSQKRWDPSDKWWTNKVDRANTPAGLGSSGPDHRLEQELWPHDARSPMDSNASPQPSQEPTDSDNSHPRALPEGPPLPHNNLPSSSYVSDAGFYPPVSSTEISNDDFLLSVSSSYDSDAGFYPSTDAYDDTASSLPSHDLNSPPRLGNLDLNLNHPATPGATDDQPPPAPPSDPGSSKRPYSPSDPGPSTSAHPPPDPEPSNRGPTPSDPGPSERPYSPSDSRPSWSTWAYDPGPPTSAHPLSSPGPLLDESETFLRELLRGTGKLKRRISGSRLVNAA